MSRSRRIEIGAVVAVCAAIPLVLWAAGVFNGGTDHSRAAPSAAPVATTTTATAPAKHQGSESRPKARRHPQPKSAPSRRAARTARARGVPWRENGISLVAHTRGRQLAVYTRPHVHHPAVVLRNPDRIGTPRVVLVHSQRNNWIRVYLPMRPNHRTGWVRRRAVELLRDPYRIVIRLRSHELELHRGTRRVLRATTVVGKASTPTPRGLFYVVDLLRPSDPGGAYGPFAFDLSAHSYVLQHFAGGDGHVAIHGTNEPWLLGQSASHGCIRVSNRVIRRLAHVLPLGTPVIIRS
jgi:lipoprotein-anchoring transpeptidase ErfK/SrfK